MTDDIAIKVENLTKIYKLYDSPTDRLKESLHWRGKKYHKDFYALKNISFEIKKGDTVGIIGKNGSGKSTLLKIITGVLTQTSGNVLVNGKVSALLELGAGFNPEYSGIENIYFQGNLMGYTRDDMESKIPEITAFADIGDFIHQPVKMYSSGMFARLAFAVAINVEPNILIVDEALSVGDMVFQAKCMTKMNSMMENGVTVIFVSHDSNAIKSLCKQALYLNEGNYVDFGDSARVVGKYSEHQALSLNSLLDGVNRDIISKPSVLPISEISNHDKIPIIVSTEQINLDYQLSQRFGDGRATILNAIVLDKDFKVTNELIAKHDYYIQMAIKFNSALDNFAVGAMLVSLDGVQQVGNVSTQENVVLPSVELDDIYVVTMKINIPIKAGTYTVTLAVEYPSMYNQHHQTLDLIRNFSVVKVNFENQDNVFHSIFYTKAEYMATKVIKS